MQGKVEICGINTARLEILKNDEMMELLRRTKQGDMAARERLIRGDIHHSAEHTGRPAEQGGHQVQAEDAHAAPVQATKDDQDQGDPVDQLHYGNLPGPQVCSPLD